MANVAPFSCPGPRQHEARRRELDGDLELRVRQRLVPGGGPHVRVEHGAHGRLGLVEGPPAVGRAPELRQEVVGRKAGDGLPRRPQALEGRLDETAGSLSGGQQQMLALAMTLVQEPDVLLIDELSLGLAPVIVQDLLRVVEELKAEGQAMVIVEQSLNVALAFADRAVFMEKGQVRFSGPAQELLERGDLARAVFLGGEGG